MAKKRLVCLLLIIIFSLGGIYTAVHLAEIHYKKPHYLLNLINTVPLLDLYYDRETLEEAVIQDKMDNGDLFYIDPFDDPDFDPYAAANPYDNIMTEEEIETGFVAQETCDISEGLSCTKVDDSEYSEIFGIAISLYGMAGYSLLIILSVICIIKRHAKPDIFALFLYLGCCGGFLFSVWLTYIEAYIIESFCPYCVASALFSTLSFIAVLVSFGIKPVTVFFSNTTSQKESADV